MEPANLKSDNKNFTIIIPMAGLGKRFKDQGFMSPKPMIEIMGKPMIDWALSCFSGLRSKHRFIFVCLEKDLANGLAETLAGKGEIVALKETPPGATASALAARELLDVDEPLLIGNCDQFIDWDINDFLREARDWDASTIVFESGNPHHSYIAAEGDRVVDVREKEVISNLACGGIYYYSASSLFIKGAEAQISTDTKTNGEFYISPIFNELITEGKRVTFYEVPNSSAHMLGTPEEVEIFLKTNRRV